MKLLEIKELNSGRHPEQKYGEKYLGNFDDKSYRNIGWKTKRKGNFAYDTNGNTIMGMFPAFVQEREVKEGI